MGILSALSRARVAGISWVMARRASFTLFMLCALALVAPACDVRPLTASQLYGAAGTGGGLFDGGGGGGGETGRPDAFVAPDGAQDVVVDAGIEASLPGCAQNCATDQYCDELTGRCAPRTGVGMLSGVVVDACTNLAVEAVVGLGGQRTCSPYGKGSYFFTGLPLGKLRLAAFAEGYVRYEATVDIVPGGVIHDIRLMRIGGCEVPPLQVGCRCSAIDCIP